MHGFYLSEFINKKQAENGVEKSKRKFIGADVKLNARSRDNLDLSHTFSQQLAPVGPQTHNLIRRNFTKKKAINGRLLGYEMAQNNTRSRTTHKSNVIEFKMLSRPLKIRDGTREGRKDRETIIFN